MLKRISILIIGILLISAHAGAMMGGQGSGGQGSGWCGSGAYGSMDETMQGHMNDMMGSDGGYGWHNGTGRQSDGQPMPRNGNRWMDQQTAETMVRRYMQNNNSGEWRLGSQVNRGTYYMSDIIGPNGDVIDRVLIDKRTGNIHSLGSK